MKISRYEFPASEYKYIKIHNYAMPIISAINMTGKIAPMMLSLLVTLMDGNNECEINLRDFDKSLGIKNPETRTRALNILRMTNIIQATNNNRNAVTKIKVNAKAYEKVFASPSRILHTFKEDLNFDVLNSGGGIDKSLIDNFKFNKRTAIVGAV